MKKLGLVICMALLTTLPLAASEVTLTFLNFGSSTFDASASGLQFGNAINVLVTNNSNGMSKTLAAIDSGSTGTATSFTPGPPLVAEFNSAGPNSVLVESGGHTFLAGMMQSVNELKADYPNGAGAFLSRFTVTFIDPAMLMSVGANTSFEPDGTVSLTLAETSFDGTTLTGVLGGGSITVTTVPEVPTLPLALSGVVLLCGFGWFKRQLSLGV